MVHELARGNYLLRARMGVGAALFVASWSVA